MSLSLEEYYKIVAFLYKKEFKDKVKTKKGFSNFMGTQQHPQALVVDIKSKDVLQGLLVEIQALNRSKKPEDRIVFRVAAGERTNVSDSASYSATPVTNADVILHLTGNDFTKINRIDKTDSVRVGASVQIGELDRKLYEFHGLSLPTSSLIPYVTVAGLSAAGGHGTGIDQPSFAGLVTGATIMLENGKEVHIDKTHEDFATIMGANNGLFGVVLDLDIQCIPRKKLQCTMEKRSVPQFIEEVEAGLFQNDPYVSVMYMPTYLKDELTNKTQKNVIIYRWRPVDVETYNTNFNPLLSDLTQDLQTALGDAVDIPDILRAYPSITPFYMRNITSKLAIGKKDEFITGSWPAMMHYRTSYPSDLDEICGIFPVKDELRKNKHGKEIIAALTQTIKLLGEHAARGEYPVTYGLYFRFFQGTNGGLSFSAHPEGSHMCAMDITTNRDIRGYAQFQKSMQDYFLSEKVKGKFHWGKNAPLDLDYAKIYGTAIDETKAVLEKWHQKYHISMERSALLNPLFSKVFGYPVPQLTSAVKPAVANRSLAVPVAAAVAPAPLVASRVSASTKRETAIAANTLLDRLTVNPIECEKLKARIADDMLKQSGLRSLSMFAAEPIPKIAPLATETEDCTHQLNALM